MSTRLLAFSHSTQVQIGSRKFTAQITLGDDEDQFHVAADNGAYGRVEAGRSSLTLSGGDEAGRTFKLTLEGTRSGKGQGTLTIGGFVFADKEGLSGISGRLLGKVTPEAKKVVPRGLTMLAYSKWLRANRHAMALTIGHGKTKVFTEQGTYCESICKCCEKGTWMSAWCCLSCASCDYFKNPVNGLGGVAIQ